MRKTTLTLISTLLLLMAISVFGNLVPGSKAEDQGRHCGLQTLNGSYGFRLDGTQVGGGPFSSVGVQTFDGKGNIVNASEYVSINGFTVAATFTGTYTVDANCTGTMTIQFDNGFSGQIYFVIVDNGKELLAMPIPPPQGANVTGTFKRQ